MSNAHHDMSKAELWDALEDAEGFERGHILYTLALRHRSDDEWSQVIIFAEQSAEVMHSIDSTREEGYAFELIGQAQDALHEHDKAIETFMKAATLFHGINLDDGLGSVYAHAGYAARHKKDHEGAAEYFAQSETFYSQCLDMQESVAGAARDLGNSLARVDNREIESLEALKRSLDHAQGNSELHFIYEVHDDLVDAYLRIHDLEKALEHAESALRLAKTCPCPHCMPVATYRLGYVLRICGKLDLANKVINDAYTIAKGNGNASLQAKCMIEFGKMQSEDDLDAAEESFKDAFIVMESTGAQGGMSVCKHWLGRVASERGSFIQACAYFKEAIDIAEDARLGSRTFAPMHQSFAKTLITQGKHREAIVVLESIAWHKSVEPINGMIVAKHMALYAQALLANGQTADALIRAEQTLEQTSAHQWHEIIAECHEVRSRVLLHKDPTAADRAAVLALAHYTLGNRHEDAARMATEFIIEPHRMLKLVAADHDFREAQ